MYNDIIPRHRRARKTIGQAGRILSALLLAAGPLAQASPKIGVFTGVSGGATRSYVDSYGAWLNRPVDYINQTIPFATFNSTTPSLLGGNWWFTQVAPFEQHYKDRMVLAVGMLPSTNDGSTLALGAAGNYDTHWRAFADRLIANGMGNTMLRLGWEFNGSWFRWSSISKQADFKNYWIRIVNAMRYLPDGVTPRPGANFKFCWNPTVGDPNGHGNPLNAYPGVGNQYVDFIGLDVYDTSVTYYKNSIDTNTPKDPNESYAVHFERIEAGQPGTLTADQILTCRRNAWNANKMWGSYHMDWWSAQVKNAASVAYGVPLCFPEWGLDNIKDSGDYLYRAGGRDNTYFVQQFYNWVNDPNNRVDWVAYFEGGDGTAGRNSQIFFSEQYPLAKAYFPGKFAAMINDNFEDGNATGWTASPSARWSVVTDAGDKAYKFDFDWSNTSGSASIGDPAWTNESLLVDFKITDLQSWSETRFYVRHTDSSNYYMLKMQDQGGPRKLLLSKTVAGTATQLGSVTVTVNANTWYTLSFNAYSTNLSVRLNNVQVMQVSDSSLAAGKVLIGGYKQDVLFDNVLVTP